MFIVPVFILIFLVPLSATSQKPDNRVYYPLYRAGSDSNYRKSIGVFIKPEIFSSGFIDIINNGQVNAAARFVRIFIGEPGKLTFPLSVYSCVNSNNFDRLPVIPGAKMNDHLVNSLINPLSGMINVSINGMLYLRRRQHKLTQTGILYHGGTRVLSGYKSSTTNDPSFGMAINFVSNYATCGFYFQTGAWEKSAAGNIGLFWSAVRYILSKSDQGKLSDVFGFAAPGLHHGWSVASGLEITKLLNIKLIVYKYSNSSDPGFLLPVYQFSFNYSLQ